METTNLCEDRADFGQNPAKYGELVFIGSFQNQNYEGQRSKKFVLFNRNVPNGVKLSTTYKIDAPYDTQVNWNTDQHTILYSLSNNQAIVVEYGHDKDTDIFQVGRMPRTGIDFALFDKNENNSPRIDSISRFACRIICNRNDPSICRIYAAGFDSSKNIFLGPSALKWETEDGADGLITNGAQIMHPNGSFSDGSAKPGIWYEVSVGGTVHCVRKPRNAQEKQMQVEDVTNVLQDGTLIDLCGAILIWRSAEGLKKIPTKKYLEELVNEVNNNKPICPVSLNTLMIFPGSNAEENLQQPYVNLACGHVQSPQNWRLDEKTGCSICPLCMKDGKIAKLQLGYEPVFYVDRESAVFYAFSPCGHMATEKTVKYWTQTFICPFCPIPSVKVSSCVRLFFN